MTEERFKFINESNYPLRCELSRTGTDKDGDEYKYSFSDQRSMNSTVALNILYKGVNGGITNLLRRLNAGEDLPLSWIICDIKCPVSGYSGMCRILPVYSVSTDAVTRKEVTRVGFIIDTTYVHAQPGGSLYDNKGKLLYRGGMKNGLPHGYGTGYYANGKVGYVGMFKGGKIIQ